MSKKEQITAAIELNQLAALREFAQGDQSELLVNSEMMRVCSGIPYPLLNFVARPRFDVRRVAERILSIVRYFGARRLPYLVYLHPSAMPQDLGHRLQQHGLQPWGLQDGMALERLSPRVHTNRDVQIEVARDAATLDEAADVYAGAYHLPAAVAGYMRAVRMTALQDPAVDVYVGRLHGIPAGTVTLVLRAGVAGLYGLGTLPEYRGRLVGTSLMVRAILDAAGLGFRAAVLQAPPGSIGLYRRLGFETFWRMEILAGGGMMQASESAHQDKDTP